MDLVAIIVEPVPLAFANHIVVGIGIGSYAIIVWLLAVRHHFAFLISGQR